MLTERTLTAWRILFVTWDGPQVSYLETLYLPIFQRLAQLGHAVHVLQFTWADAKQCASIRSQCEDAGVSYCKASVLRWPRAAGGLLTAMLGARHVSREIAAGRIDIVLPRSTLPAIACMLALRGRPAVKMLFDADGLPHDERVDFAGLSPQSVSYRLLRDLEASAVRRADAVLTRSSKAMEILLARAGAGTGKHKFIVAGNGRDTSLFAPTAPSDRSALRRELQIEETAPLLVYAGSIGAQYCVREMFDFFQRVRARRADARFLLLTGSPEEAERALAAHASLAAACLVRRVDAALVPRFLAAADLGLALRRPSFSMQAVAPIKLGEYLLCGVPVLATRAIGDTEDLIPEGAGRLIESMSSDALDAAADWFVHAMLPARESFRQQARAAGLQDFDVASTVDCYTRALTQAVEAHA